MKQLKKKIDLGVRNLSTRGKILTGIVIATNSAKTAKIEFQRIIPLRKYERFEKRRTRLIVHNPETINAKVGDKVKIAECRPLSKTKNFIIIEKIK